MTIFGLRESANAVPMGVLALTIALLRIGMPASYAQSASAAKAAGQAQVNASGLRMSVSAVEPGAFHIVAASSQLPEPPASPFVVEQQQWSKANVKRSANGGTAIQTPIATLCIGPSGVFTLQASKGAAIIRSGRISSSGNGMTVALAHGTDQRLYGAGNADENVSGDLTHHSGTQVTKNGATRIPFLWSTGGYGALIANNETGISWSDSADLLTWQVPGPYLDLYLMVAPNGGYGLLDAYSRLTGRAPIPPRWTFGYMQSRWGYADAADVRDKWHQFRDRKIPVDAFIYDYDWFVNDWEFNPKTFPSGSLAEMKRLGLHFVGIRKPRVNGANLDYAMRQGWILRSPLGTDLRFDIPAARYWWWSHQAPLVKDGVDGWWNDEAEQTADEFFQMAQTEWDGWRAMSPRRAWSINRAFAPGMQRFGAACWTGDINSDWTTLANQPGTLLNWGLAGMPYTGQDIGGFQSTPSPELYARWIEEGVFVPVMRSHGTLDSPRWPWAFGDDVLAAIKQAIELRYRLIPYLYTCAAETSRTGAPMMRPLLLDFPNDAATFNLRDEWLLGHALLAAPILVEGESRSVYLPAGKWYDFNTNKSLTGSRTVMLTNTPLATIPVYIRAGAILPLGPIMQYTGEKPEDPLEVRVYPGANGAFSLYEDAGDDYGYLKGGSSQIPFTWDDAHHRLKIGKRIGSYPGMLPIRHLNIVLPDGRARSVIYSGHAVAMSF